MSSATPTPIPNRRNDDVTQPNAVMPPSPEDARRGLTRSPAQWEAEALAMVEEADARTGIAAGMLRYAAARMFEDGVGDLAGAMDHLQLALDEPPSATFRPVLRALRLHAIEAGSPWTAIDLLDVEMVAVGTVAAKAELRSRRRVCSRTRWARASGPGRSSRRRCRWCRATPRPCSPWRRARSGAATTRLLQSVLDRRLAAASSAGERGRLLCRLALLAEANAERTTEALDLWLRALDEEAGKGAAALARAGTRRVAARIGKDAALARAVELEAEAAAGPERAAWLALGGGAGAPSAGRLRARGGADRGGARRRSE